MLFGILVQYTTHWETSSYKKLKMRHLYVIIIKTLKCLSILKQEYFTLSLYI